MTFILIHDAPRHMSVDQVGSSSATEGMDMVRRTRLDRAAPFQRVDALRRHTLQQQRHEAGDRAHRDEATGHVAVAVELPAGFHRRAWIAWDIARLRPRHRIARSGRPSASAICARQAMSCAW